ncbi:hypothetical protein V6Z93_000245 [Aspergillus fumigatus]|jgi:hypothetical protein
MITFATLIGISIENWRNWTWHYLAHLVAEFFFCLAPTFRIIPFFSVGVIPPFLVKGEEKCDLSLKHKEIFCGLDEVMNHQASCFRLSVEHERILAELSPS